MGASSSKAAKQLPTATNLARTAQRSAGAGTGAPSEPANGGNPPARPPHPAMAPPPQGEAADPLMEAPNYLEQGLGGETRTSDGLPNQVPGSKRPEER